MSVIVSVNVPRLDFLEVLTVSVDVVAVGFGLNEALLREGRPLALSETLPLKLLTGVMVTVYVASLPWTTVLVAGVALIVKSAAGAGCDWTTSVTWALWLRVPSEPVTVSVYEPAGVDALVATVSVEDPVGEVAAGLNVPVAPLGSPATDQVTEPVYPLVAVALAVYVVDPPAVTAWLAGDAETVKSGAAVAPQPATLNVPIRVCQLNAPLDARYSFVYQNVHWSFGSTVRSL